MALLDAYEATLDAEIFSSRAAHHGRCDREIWRYNGRRFLRSSLRCPRDGRSGSPAQAIPGFAHAQRELRGRHGAYPHARLHRRIRNITSGPRTRWRHSPEWRRNTACSPQPMAWQRRSSPSIPPKSWSPAPQATRPPQKLEDAANDRLSPRQSSPARHAASPLENLPMALRQDTAAFAQGQSASLVCAGTTCLPPTSDPEELKRILQKGIAGTAAG